MPTLTQEIREQLLTYDQEFQKLAQLHSEYEAKLRQLSQSSYLNLEDLQQEATLKKLKLESKTRWSATSRNACIIPRRTDPLRAVAKLR